jgi:lysophospholipase L1-like esterase
MQKSKLKLLFIGDSITRGRLGVSYVDIVQKRFPSYEITNLGRDGETINLVFLRLFEHLKKTNDYDYIFFAGGLVDAVFPSFLEKGKMFEFAYWVQEKKGIIAKSNSIDFYEYYKSNIIDLKSICSANIVLVTLNCCNEKLDYKYNLVRDQFNAEIKKIVAEEKLFLADAAKEVNQYLSGKNQRQYSFENFWTVTYTDKLFTLFNSGADWLSQLRKLHTTIDGIHLNSKGAELFAKSVIEVLEI